MKLIFVESSLKLFSPTSKSLPMADSSNCRHISAVCAGPEFSLLRKKSAGLWRFGHTRPKLQPRRLSDEISKDHSIRCSQFYPLRLPSPEEHNSTTNWVKYDQFELVPVNWVLYFGILMSWAPFWKQDSWVESHFWITIIFQCKADCHYPGDTTRRSLITAQHPISHVWCMNMIDLRQELGGHLSGSLITRTLSFGRVS